MMETWSLATLWPGLALVATLAYYVLHWNLPASWLAGVALSTTSVAVVYAVMIEFGFNKTDYGKTVLAACFINDLVIAIELLFAPFTWKTSVFVGCSVVVFAVRRIVLGHRGKSFFGRWRPGPVSKQVFHYAHCAVTVAR